MDSYSEKAHLEIEFHGRLADQYKIPVSVLARALEGMQRSIQLLAMEHVELSPFYLTQIEYEDKVLKFKQQLTLEPELDDSKQLLRLYHEPLGIDVFAYTRDELEDELISQIEFL